MAREQLQNIMISDYVVTSVDIERSDFDNTVGLSSIDQIQNNLELTAYAKSKEVNIEYVKDDSAIYLSAGTNVTSVDTADFVLDGMLSDAYVDQTTKKLVLIFNTDAGSKSIQIPLSDFAKIYEAGNGLSINGTTIGVSADYATNDDVTTGLNKKVDLTSFSWNDDTTIGQMFNDLSNAFNKQ